MYSSSSSSSTLPVGFWGVFTTTALTDGIGQGSPQLVAVQPPRSGAAILAQGHEARHEPEDRRLRRVQLVIGLHHHHAVARAEQRAERGRHALAGPEHHGDLLLGVGPVAVARLRVVGDRVPQLGESERERSTG